MHLQRKRMLSIMIMCFCVLSLFTGNCYSNEKLLSELSKIREELEDIPVAVGFLSHMDFVGLTGYFLMFEFEVFYSKDDEVESMMKEISNGITIEKDEHALKIINYAYTDKTTETLILRENWEDIGGLEGVDELEEYFAKVPPGHSFHDIFPGVIVIPVEHLSENVQYIFESIIYTNIHRYRILIERLEEDFTISIFKDRIFCEFGNTNIPDKKNPSD